MRAAAVTSHTMDGRDHDALIVFIKAKIFFVDPAGHLEHVPGDVFFRLGIAGEIQLVGAVLGGSMTETAFHTQRISPTPHDMMKTIVAYIPGQDLQVSFWLILLRAACGHADDHHRKKGGDDGDLFVMKHRVEFGALR